MSHLMPLFLLPLNTFRWLYPDIINPINLVSADTSSTGPASLFGSGLERGVLGGQYQPSLLFIMQINLTSHALIPSTSQYI